MSLSNNIGLNSVLKPCAWCPGSPTVGWDAWRERQAVISAPQQFRLTCDETIRKASGDVKQRYGASHIADDLPEYIVKTFTASLRRQGQCAKATLKFSLVSYRAYALPVLEDLLT